MKRVLYDDFRDIDFSILPYYQIDDVLTARAECYAHYECMLYWLRPIETNTPVNTLIQGSIVNATVDDAYLLPNIRETLMKQAIAR